ncbi:MAG: hypothetical protein J7L89_02320 [Bacteroidales bacterium]|nr:hypothetical protein [Bacteroidales bacterium]
MRILWLILATLILGLLTWFTGQMVILILELAVIDLFVTRRINWFFWLKKDYPRIPSWIQIIVWILLSAWVVRIFMIDNYTEMASSMKPVILKGDNVLVSKITFGPRMPVTPVNIPLAHHYFPFSRCRPSYLKSIELPYTRLRAARSVRRGDLLVYNFPEGDTALCGVETVSYYALKRTKLQQGDSIKMKNTQYRPVDRREVEFSRCAALPGDTIQISMGKVTINNVSREPDEEISFDYLVEVENRQLPEVFLRKLGLEQSEIQIYPGLGYSMPLRSKQLPLIRQRPEVLAYHPNILPPDQPDFNIFPHHPHYLWNRDNFGPLIVPRQGDSVRLTLVNLPVYKRIIRVYEDNTLFIQDGNIYINNKPADYYHFKQNYFFVLGDNRHHSRDSRHWGFLPEDHIIGKPVCVWFSLQRFPDSRSRIRTKRFFTFLK